MSSVRMSVKYFKFLDFKKKFEDLTQCSWQSVHCGCHSAKLLNLYVWQLNFRVFCFKYYQIISNVVND